MFLIADTFAITVALRARFRGVCDGIIAGSGCVFCFLKSHAHTSQKEIFSKIIGETETNISESDGKRPRQNISSFWCVILPTSILIHILRQHVGPRDLIVRLVLILIFYKYCTPIENKLMSQQNQSNTLIPYDTGKGKHKDKEPSSSTTRAINTLIDLGFEK